MTLSSHQTEKCFFLVTVPGKGCRHGGEHLPIRCLGCPGSSGSCPFFPLSAFALLVSEWPQDLPSCRRAWTPRMESSAESSPVRRCSLVESLARIPPPASGFFFLVMTGPPLPVRRANTRSLTHWHRGKLHSSKSVRRRSMIAWSVFSYLFTEKGVKLPWPIGTIVTS
jgi:hypothetical protein